MILDRVTITGADQWTYIPEMVEISQEFPFVEWGILFSAKHQGVSPRYPAEEWLQALRKTAEKLPLNLSAHLCGRWVRDVVIDASLTFKEQRKDLWPLFQRVQLNFHAEPHKRHHAFAGRLLEDPGKQYIFQIDGRNDDLWEHARTVLGDRAVPLFDRSGGAGELPDQWPKVFEDVYGGYAGGLGPDNLTSQLELIEAAAGKARIWIDMETRVRTEEKFDLAKVRRAVEQASEWIEL